MGTETLSEIERKKHPHFDLPYQQKTLADFTDFNWKKDGCLAEAVYFARINDHNETGMSVNECALLYTCLEALGTAEPTIVELGRNYGTSTRLFIQHVIRHGGRLESWDFKHWKGVVEGLKVAGMDLSGPNEDEEYYALSYRNDVYDVRFRIAHSVKTPIFQDERFVDFLLIDTEHGLEDALGEIMRWRQYLKSGSMIAFHDAMLPGVQRAMSIYEEVESAFEGRIVRRHENERVDGFGLMVYEWQR